MKRLVQWTIVVACVLGAAMAGAAELLLGPGDVVKIAVYGSPDLATEARISEGGMLTFQLLGEVQVGGLTPQQAEKKIGGLLESGGYIRKDFDKPGLKWQFLNGTQDDYYDVYGDGTLTTIFTPGHAPGHQSFLVRLPNSKPLLLTIDAAYTLDHWEEKALPGFLASTVDTVRSVQKLRTYAEKHDATVVTGHDPDAWANFKKAPEFYA